MAKRLRPKRPRRASKPVRPTPAPLLYEVEVLEGLAPFVRAELEHLGADVIASENTAVRFYFSGDARDLHTLRTAVAVYRLETFSVPRPKALLGHEHLSKLLQTVREVTEREPFTSFRFSAAGRESGVFARLADELAKATELRHDPDEGDLLLRVRKARAGWEVLVRTTPRPLSSRPWRVCNLPGGLNAALAAALLELVRAGPQDRFLNAMCGSGTLLIERRTKGRAARLIGCDVSVDALACAEANVQASGLADTELLQADATALPFEDASFDVIVADVPWGDAVGTHAGNAALYPAFLEEAARVAAPGARLVVLTHDIKLFEKILDDFGEWQLISTTRVFHGGHYPRIYLFTRR